MRVSAIHEGWEFLSAEAPSSIFRHNIPKPCWGPATVPGAVHLDLIRSGVIRDPFAGQYEAGCQWVDLQPWSYRTTFEWQPKDGCPRRALRFDGLDTVCEVFLNGDRIGTSDNMFLPLEIDVSDRLSKGLNELRLEFAAAVRVGEARRREYFDKEGLDWGIQCFDERAFVRKAGYMSGWDWGPRLVSCGIWQPVKLIEYESRIKSFAVFAEREGNGFRVRTRTMIEGEGRLSIDFDGRTASEELDLLTEGQGLWWPNGHGDQPLYEVKARLAGGHEVTKKIGFREIRLLREPDDFGESFEFEVNGRKIWSRGANWIPNDSFPGRITAQDYGAQISTCASLNMNMLRVWGGGIYENEAFYDTCDRHGILVWQDFPYACSYYPDDASAREAAAAEAAYHVERLRHRACLALWCGNNENLTMWEQKWGGADSPPRYCGEPIYEVTLPHVMAELDPGRPYIATSPIGALSETKEPVMANEGGFGDQHYWDAWHGRGDWTYYEESTARFCSEFGFASSPSLAQWAQVLSGPEDWHFDSQTVRWHDKTNKPFEVFLEFVELHYPEVESLEDWVYYSQLNQRDALRYAIEHYRSSEFCRGALIWQFNDCWPVQSWAVQDGLRLLKPAGYELKRLYGREAICLKRESGRVLGTVAADPPGTCSSVRMDAYSTLDGCVLWSRELEVRDGRFEVDTSAFDSASTALRFGFADGESGDRWHLLAEPKEVKFGAPEFEFDGKTLVVKGFAADLMVWDADDVSNGPVWDGLRGYRVHTIANDRLTVEFDRPPDRLRIRTLAGAATVSARGKT